MTLRQIIISRTSKWTNAPVSIGPLVVFRVLFGLMMLASGIRFMAKGWVDAILLQPRLHFSYFGFEWVQVLDPILMYAFFGVMLLAALGITLGAFYRASAIGFFLSFTYIELIDKTNYLNHYYFVSLVAFILILLPANRSFSIDGWIKPNFKRSHVPSWCVNILKLQLGLVYFFAGAAKLNADWMLDAMPLAIWLPAQANFPLIGEMLTQKWTAYAFSWGGALYDLSIPFLLLYRPTRMLAYGAVIGFHLMTSLLFPIGMFPYIMIVSTLIFFPASVHDRFLMQCKALLKRLTQSGKLYTEASGQLRFSRGKNALLTAVLGTFLLIQLFLPLRFLLYPGDLFWTEEGYRFSWRVMLMEKAGYATFKVRDPQTNREFEVRNYDFLTPNQEKMMATQPDMILQFAHFLEKEYIKLGINDPEVRVECYVTLNGSPSQLLIDPSVDLTQEEDGFEHKSWILSSAP